MVSKDSPYYLYLFCLLLLTITKGVFFYYQQLSLIIYSSRFNSQNSKLEVSFNFQLQNSLLTVLLQKIIYNILAAINIFSDSRICQIYDFFMVVLQAPDEFQQKCYCTMAQHLAIVLASSLSRFQPVPQLSMVSLARGLPFSSF